MSANTFHGRSLTAAGDWTVEEQRYLYQKTRELKHAWDNDGDLSPFCIEAKDWTVWLMFLETSTRTKESFRCAANFHQNVKLNVFDAATSSLSQKGESMLDTVKMLFGYSKRSIFIMRTKMEGVCLAMEEQLGEYADRIGRPRPVFLNAGDGRHEHPTQEYLDEFTFLEHLQWNDSEIHLALIGDLLHGRTVHSKADGLKVFGKVIVDLVAPPELAMPVAYVNRMHENGFEVRTYTSIAAYLESGNVSNIWYFTRLQLERMGDEILDREKELRRSVTFHNPAWMEQLPPNTRFYHPLPRHREKPTIPNFLDHTPLNGWDGQSINGFFTRVVELALVTGQVGHDYKGPVGRLTESGLVETKNHSRPQPEQLGSIPTGMREYITEVPVTRKTRIEDQWKVGIKPVDDGTVIDHIAKGMTPEQIWDRIHKIRRILKLNVRGSHGVFHGNDPTLFKGIMSLPDVLSMAPTELKKLAAASPGCTVNVIANQSVQCKYRLAMPPRIYNFAEISCKNVECVTARQAYQNVGPHFYRTGEDTFTCKYCGQPHEYPDIWDY